MAIPGLKPTYEVRAKIRLGKKVEKQRDNGSTVSFPTSVDHFLCEDEEFNRLYPDRPKSIQIVLPFLKPEDNFGTGLEWWEGNLLACYSKGETQEVIIGVKRHDDVPIALRRISMKKDGKPIDLLKGETVVSEETVGNERKRIVCPVRECRFMKDKKCKPMGRLQFFLVGADKTQGVYQIDTKSWNSVEQIEASLALLGDPRGVPLTLTIKMESHGTKKFPVLSLEVPKVEVTTENLKLADALVELATALKTDESPDTDLIVRRKLAKCLDHSTPGWKDNERLIEKLKEVGVRKAAAGLLNKLVPSSS